MKQHCSVTKEDWRICPECKDPIGKWDKVAKDKKHCKHCFTKLRYGSVDINNCFKGSVIIID
jgi:predicted amidophosphoribosyltransferase